MKIETEIVEENNPPYEEIRLENVKEMLKESEEQLDGLTKGRELLDQKITYFLGILFFVVSGTAGLGLKPFLKMVVDRNYFMSYAFFGLISVLCMLIVVLVRVLLPKRVYLKGHDPLLFWEKRILFKSQQEMIFSLPELRDCYFIHEESHCSKSKDADCMCVPLCSSSFYFHPFSFSDPFFCGASTSISERSVGFRSDTSG